jgi:hypothetical protein
MITTQSKRHRHRRPLYRLAVVAGVCALAIPASASASYGSAPDNGSGTDTVTRDAGLVAPDHTSLNASLNSSDTSGADLSAPQGTDSSSGHVTDSSGYSSPNAITGGSNPEPTFVSSASAASDPFDWGDAALGAGVAMALMTLGGVALIVLRRRTPISPTASAG